MGIFNSVGPDLIPTQDQSILSSNYFQWNDAAGENFADFAQQYLPEIYEARSRALWKQNVIWILKNGWR